MNTNAITSLQHKQAFLRVLMFSFATILVWVGFSLFRSQQKTGISPELQKLALPLNPNIHVEVVDRIRQKRAFSDQELQGFPILRVLHNADGTQSISTNKATPVPSASPLVTPSPATPTPTISPLLLDTTSSTSLPTTAPSTP